MDEPMTRIIRKTSVDKIKELLHSLDIGVYRFRLGVKGYTLATTAIVTTQIAWHNFHICYFVWLLCKLRSVENNL